ncbi:MAG: ribD [Acidimicrobiia bacterium]|nr:ribD [Acidimicrobiia bacterium]
MSRALAVAATARRVSPPNPWVGAVLVTADGRRFTGATEAPGSRHAEIVAIDTARAAGADPRQATLVVTLEPCNHLGRTGPCTEAIVTAGISTVVVGVEDPDPLVAGRGLQRLRQAGLAVSVGTKATEVAEQLAPYLHHRRTGRPLVVLKLAATLDGRIAAPDGTSRWITGPEARHAVHQLRAESDAVLVGAGTVRADDPELTVRHGDGPDPQRVVLGTAPVGAKVHPCWELRGPLPGVLDELAARGVLQLLVEGGATVAHSFHSAGLVDRYVIHLAPAFSGGNDAPAMFHGVGAGTLSAFWRGRIVNLRALGSDIEIVLAAETTKEQP